MILRFIGSIDISPMVKPLIKPAIKIRTTEMITSVERCPGTWKRKETVEMSTPEGKKVWRRGKKSLEMKKTREEPYHSNKYDHQKGYGRKYS